MKKFLIVMTAAIILAGSNFAEATPFSNEQLDKIFIDADKNAAKINSELNLNTAQLQEKFNGIITPIVKEALGSDDISALEHLVLIKDYKIIGDTFANVFGDYRVAIVGKTAASGNFKELSLCYTTPEENDESIFTIWLLTAFVKSIAPEVNPQALMGELTEENSPRSVVKDNVKFSIAEDGNLNILTATAE